MTNKDFINVKTKDKFHKDYKLTKADIKTAFFYVPFLLALVFLVVRLWFVKY